jgi:hypothetical protein
MDHWSQITALNIEGFKSSVPDPCPLVVFDVQSQKDLEGQRPKVWHID